MKRDPSMNKGLLLPSEAKNQGIVDVLHIEDGQLFIEGWAAFQDGDIYVPPHSFLISINGTPVGVLAPNLPREDVRLHLDATTEAFGFAARISHEGLFSKDAEDVPAQVDVFALDGHNHAVRLTFSPECLSSKTAAASAGAHYYSPPVASHTQVHGHVDVVRAEHGQLTIEGWSAFVEGGKKISAAAFLIIVDGQPVGWLAPNVVREDVQRALSVDSGTFGFTASIELQALNLPETYPFSKGVVVYALSANGLAARISALVNDESEYISFKPAQGQGFIDVLHIEGEQLFIEGWGAVERGDTPVPPHKFLIIINGVPAGVLAPNLPREDVRLHLGAATAVFGFAAKISLNALPQKAPQSVQGKTEVFALDESNCAVRLCMSNQSQSLQAVDASIGAHYCELPAAGNAQGRGNVDDMRAENGRLTIKGWGAFVEDGKNVPAAAFLILVNGTLAGVLAPNQVREDVQRALCAKSGSFGFAASIDLHPLDLPEDHPFHKSVVVYALKDTGLLVQIFGFIEKEPVCIDFSMEDIIANGCTRGDSRDVLSVLWMLTEGCNYRCSYCFCRKTFKKFSTKEQLLRAADALLGMKRPGYQITLYGGEPTYHPHCIDLINYLCSQDAPINLRLFTNGSRPPEYFEKLLKALQGKKLKLIFSLHLEHAEVENFLRGVELTASAGLKVGVNFMYSPEHLEKARVFADGLLKLRNKVPFFFSQPFVYDADGHMGKGSSEEDVSFRKDLNAAFAAFPALPPADSPFYTRIESNIVLEKNNTHIALPQQMSLKLLESNHTPCYKDFYCCAGSNVFFIHEDGSVNGAVCDHRAPIGNAFVDTPERLAQGMQLVRCTAPGCNSIENIPLPKFKLLSEAEAYLAAAKERSLGYVRDTLVSMTQVSKAGCFSENRFGLHVEWSLTDMCNYSCSYCTGYHKLDRQRFPTQQEVDHALENIFSLQRPHYTFCLLGGEPTTHPHFLHILENIHAARVPVCSYTVTNASKSEKFFAEYAAIVRGKNHFVLISFHPEQASIDAVARKVEILASQGIYTRVHVMCYLGEPGAGQEVYWMRKWQEAVGQLTELRKSLPFFLDLVPLMEKDTWEHLDSRYTKEHFSYIDQARQEFSRTAKTSGQSIANPFPESDAVYVMNSVPGAPEVPVASLGWDEAIAKGLRSFNGFYCCSGTNEIFVDHAGNVFGAKCSELSVPALNIFTPHADWSKLPQITLCGAETCVCPSNDSLPKFRDIEEARECLHEFRQWASKRTV